MSQVASAVLALSSTAASVPARMDSVVCSLLLSHTVHHCTSDRPTLYMYTLAPWDASTM